MQTEEEFRTRLQDDLRDQTPPPLGTLASDAFSTGKRMRRRQRTLRVAGGTAALVAVAVGSATVSGAFASSSGVSATSGETRVQGTPIPSVWTVPPPADVADPVPTTPRAVVAELQLLLPPGAASTKVSGWSGYTSPGSRELWNVGGDLTIATAKGPAEIRVELTKDDPGTAVTTEPGCSAKYACHTVLYDDGTRVIVQHNWSQDQTRTLGAFAWVIRPDGMSVMVTVHDQSKWTDGELFAVASNEAWGSLKMEKTFVDLANASVKGDFTSPPA